MNYRRYYVPNAIVFVTQVVHERRPAFNDAPTLALLRNTMRRVQELHPFRMWGYVFLPDHFHCMFQPTGESNFSRIMHSIKTNFTYQHKKQIGETGSLRFWQQRFWDHVIRSPEDFANHLDYIHYNPVKHGYVERPEAWPHSSYGEWRKRGAYAERWGWKDSITFSDDDWKQYE